MFPYFWRLTLPFAITSNNLVFPIPSRRLVSHLWGRHGKCEASGRRGLTHNANVIGAQMLMKLMYTSPRPRDLDGGLSAAFCAFDFEFFAIGQRLGGAANRSIPAGSVHVPLQARHFGLIGLVPGTRNCYLLGQGAYTDPFSLPHSDSETLWPRPQFGRPCPEQMVV